MGDERPTVKTASISRARTKSAAPPKQSSATAIKALARKPPDGGRYSVTAKPKVREAPASSPPRVTVVEIADGVIQLESDGTTIELTHSEARALADKLLLVVR